MIATEALISRTRHNHKRKISPDGRLCMAPPLMIPTFFTMGRIDLDCFFFTLSYKAAGVEQYDSVTHMKAFAGASPPDGRRRDQTASSII